MSVKDDELSRSNESFQDEESVDNSLIEDDEDLMDFEKVMKDNEIDKNLDYYDPKLLDDTKYEDMTAKELRKAEDFMDKRDLKSLKKKNKDAKSLNNGLNISSLFNNLNLNYDVYHVERHEIEELQTKLNENSLIFEKPVYEAVKFAKMSLHESSISSDRLNDRPMNASKNLDLRVKQLISTIFKGFLWYHKLEQNENSDPKSENVISSGKFEINHIMADLQKTIREEKSSFEINLEELIEYEPKLADWIVNNPIECLEIFDTITTGIAKNLHFNFYSNSILRVRLVGSKNVKNLRQVEIYDINKFITVEGVCVKRSETGAQLSVIYFKCSKCGNENNGPYDKEVLSTKNLKQVCLECQSTNGFTIAREKTLFRNYQKLTIQELTGSIPAGNVPHQRRVILLDDLVESVRPGEEVVISGILHVYQDILITTKMNFPIFEQALVANSIKKQKERQIESLTQQEIDYIRKLSKNPNVREKILKSIAPSIWGHQYIKNALAIVMFGGNRKEIENKHIIRGDINILIIGDPGMGKSQFLKYVEHIFPRTVLTTGKGASAVGLTAAVKRDHHSGEWVLEGGAFVLADEGICLIDEFDKMNDRDRVSIHEAMEQQSISISKAGIVATLRARCAVIAAANPIGGKYNPSLSLNENIELGDPILSRFDIICVLKDQAFPLQDLHLAEHVINSHVEAHQNSLFVNSHKENDNEKRENDNFDDEEKTEFVDSKIDENGLPKWVTDAGPIPKRFLTQYILYARKWCKPQLQQNDEVRLVEFYSSLRQATAYTGGLLMTVRHLESIIRISIANAKMRLSPVVSRADIDYAIATVLESFVQSQKNVISVALSKKFGIYRALANSPEELLDTLLLDNFARKYKENLTIQKLNQQNTNLDYLKIELNDFYHLAKALHGLPDVVVDHYIKSKKFGSKYLVEQIMGTKFVIPVKPTLQNTQ